MNIAKKIIVVLLTLSASITAGASTLKPARVHSALPPPLLTAGVLRIESERSYKLSLQKQLDILQGVTDLDAERSVEAQKKMQAHLSVQAGKSEKIIKALDKANNALEGQYEGLQKINLANVGLYYDINEDLLNKLNFLSFALESEANEEGARIVALALRQAALAQRIAKISLLQAVHTSYAARQGLKVDLTQSKIEFVKGLELLAPEGKSNRMISDRIELTKQQWMFYESAINSPKNTSSLTTISTTSDRIAEVMIEIVHIAFGLPTPKTPGARIVRISY
jgi:hypothetical protein